MASRPRGTLLRLMGMDERELNKIARSMSFFGTDTEENQQGSIESQLSEVTARVAALEENLSRRLRALEDIFGKIGKVSRISRHDTTEEKTEERKSSTRKKSAVEMEDAVAIRVTQGQSPREALQQVMDDLQEEDEDLKIVKDGKVRGVDAFFACLSGRLVRCERKCDEGNLQLSATKRLLEWRLQTGLSGMLEITRSCQHEQSVERVRLEATEKHVRDMDGHVKAALLLLGNKPKSVHRAGEITELPAKMDTLSSSVTDLSGQLQLVAHDVEALQAPVTRLDNCVRDMDARIEKLEASYHELSLLRNVGDLDIEQNRRCSWWSPERWRGSQRRSCRVQDDAASPLHGKVASLEGKLRQLNCRFEGFLAELNGLRF